MIRILTRIDPLVAFSAIAAAIAVAYGIWGYLDYFVPADDGCSGDPACIAEIAAERRMDFIWINIGMLFAFIMSLGLFMFGLTVVVAIRDRWSFRK